MLTRRAFIAWVLGLLGGCHMPRGLPDDSNVVKEGPTWALSDHAELAARLGSIVTFDRLGTVLELETFLHGMARWAPALWGVGSAVVLSSTRAQVDGVSLALVSGTGVDPGCQAVWFIAYPELSCLGYEASYCISGTRYQIIHSFEVFKGTYYLNFSLRWTLTTGVIEYRDVAPGWVDTGVTVIPAAHTHLFNRIKLVGNSLTGEYVRMLVNEQGYSLRGFFAEHVAAGDAPHIQAVSTIWGNGGIDMTVYLDSCIFTESEPFLG